MSILDLTSNMSFLRNEFSKIFEKIFADNMLKLVGYKIFTRKLLKLKWNQKPFPTAWG